MDVDMNGKKRDINVDERFCSHNSVCTILFARFCSASDMVSDPEALPF